MSTKSMCQETTALRADADMVPVTATTAGASARSALAAVRRRHFEAGAG
jgi:hypothetical protein